MRARGAAGWLGAPIFFIIIITSFLVVEIIHDSEGRGPCELRNYAGAHSKNSRRRRRRRINLHFRPWWRSRGVKRARSMIAMIPTNTSTQTKERAAPTKNIPQSYGYPVNVWTWTRTPLLLRLASNRIYFVAFNAQEVSYYVDGTIRCSSKSSCRHCGTRQEREKEKTRTGKLWLSFRSLVSFPREINKNNWENTNKPKSWKLRDAAILMESAIAVCAHYNNATWNRNNNNKNNNWEEFWKTRPHLKPCRMFPLVPLPGKNKTSF